MSKNGIGLKTCFLHAECARMYKNLEWEAGTYKDDPGMPQIVLSKEKRGRFRARQRWTLINNWLSKVQLYSNLSLVASVTSVPNLYQG